MKKLALLTLLTGFFAVSCGTKEKQMSSSDTDSTTIDAATAAPVVTDTMTTVPMDSMKVDSMTAPVSQ